MAAASWAIVTDDEEDKAVTVTGIAARNTYEFFTVMTLDQRDTLLELGSVRLGRYTSLRQHAAELGYDGELLAIQREEHVSRTPLCEWPAAERFASLYGKQEHQAPVGYASACSQLLADPSGPRPQISRVVFRIEFTAIGYAHFRHMGDLKQSWDSWWRLYGDL